jgi:hypothetical protein
MMNQVYLPRVDEIVCASATIAADPPSIRCIAAGTRFRVKHVSDALIWLDVIDPDDGVDFVKLTAGDADDDTATLGMLGRFAESFEDAPVDEEAPCPTPA